VKSLITRYNQKVKRRGLAGLDTAIILIAFIITASVLAYVAINMGLFVTQKAKTTISKGEETASTALTLSSSVLYAVNYPLNSLSYWIYFTVSPSSGISSVELSPQTTAISFTAASSGISLSNIYISTLLNVTSVQPAFYNGYYTAYLLTSSKSPNGQTYYYYANPYAAVLALAEQPGSSSYLVVSPNPSTGATVTAPSAPHNTFTFQYGGVTYTAYILQTFAFTFPVAGDPLVGSAIAPAGSTIGVMILFGPNADQVYQYQTITIQITPNIGSPLTISQYVYQPQGNVSVIG
jgi:archaeal flagellin N-terminal-like domain